MSMRRSARNHASVANHTEAVPTSLPILQENSRKRTNTTAAKSANGTKRVKKSNAETASNEFKVPAPPSTPKRRSSKATNPPPLTPTPSLVKVLAPYSSGDIDDSTPPPLNRPVEPHIAAATLTTPNGTQQTAYPTSFTDPDSSPSNTSTLPPATSTTGVLLSQAVEHLNRADPRMVPLTTRHHCHVFSPTGLAETIDPFRSLASGIMAQQVSGAAAKSIKNKFISLFHSAQGKSETENATFPTPAQVVAFDIPTLRTAGLSQRKAEYIHGLAEKFVSGELSTSALLRASDEEVMESLIAVRGLGKWSVEMFACFGLKRMDVFSTGDLGVQRGMAAFIGRDVRKLKDKGGGKWKYMSEKEMLEVAENFRPYRSLFMWYMWRVGDVDVDAVQDA